MRYYELLSIVSILASLSLWLCEAEYFPSQPRKLLNAASAACTNTWRPDASELSRLSIFGGPTSPTMRHSRYTMTTSDHKQLRSFYSSGAAPFSLVGRGCTNGFAAFTKAALGDFA